MYCIWRGSVVSPWLDNETSEVFWVPGTVLYSWFHCWNPCDPDNTALAVAAKLWTRTLLRSFHITLHRSFHARSVSCTIFVRAFISSCIDCFMHVAFPARYLSDLCISSDIEVFHLIPCKRVAPVYWRIVCCWEKSKAVITKEDKIFKEAWWKYTWMCMNMNETSSYCTYCFRCGPVRHVQTRNVIRQIFSPRIPHGEGPCRIVQEAIEAWWYECIYKYRTKENLSCRQRYEYETIKAGWY
jgi:hypothetical protein